MAHPCYSCSDECYCNGSIDDVIVDKTPKNCTGCDGCQEYYKILEESYGDSLEGECQSCKNWDNLVALLDPDTGEATGKEICYDCCGKEGYCFGCGAFSADSLEYDNSKVGYYCESCQEQILDNYD